MVAIPPGYFVIHSEAESGSIAASKTMDLEVPRWANGIDILVDVDTLTGTSPTLDISVVGLLPGEAKSSGGNDIEVAISGASLAQITTSNDDTQHKLSIHPALTAVANVAVSQLIPRKVRVKLTLGGTGSPKAPATVVGCFVP